jgi:hypothetical protein
MLPNIRPTREERNAVRSAMMALENQERDSVGGGMLTTVTC